jgi:hypothetical protein
LIAFFVITVICVEWDRIWTVLRTWLHPGSSAVDEAPADSVVQPSDQRVWDLQRTIEVQRIAIRLFQESGDADTERLDWLEKWKPMIDRMMGPWRLSVWSEDLSIMHAFSDPDLRTAIDRAMQTYPPNTTPEPAALPETVESQGQDGPTKEGPEWDTANKKGSIRRYTSKEVYEFLERLEQMYPRPTIVIDELGMRAYQDHQTALKHWTLA